MSNVLGSEVVEFHAQGLDDIIDKTASLEEVVRKAHAAQMKQIEALQNPAFAKAATDLARIKARTDDLTKAERAQREQAVRSARLASGEYAMRVRMRDQEAKAARAAAQAERAAELSGGLYAARSRAAARGDRKDGRLGLMEQQSDLRSGVSLYRARTAAAAAVAEGRLAQGLRGQALASGLYGQQSRDTARLDRGNARLANAERNDDLKSGATLYRAKTAAAVEQADAKFALATRRLALTSGLFSQQIAARTRLEKDATALAKMERQAELQTLYGRRVGGAMALGERVRPGLVAGAGTLAAAGAVGVGMARAGFSGTVQEYTLNREIKLLNREVANALVPAMRELTGAIRWMRRQLEKLTPEQQKWLGRGVAGAAIAGAGLGGLVVAGKGVKMLADAAKWAGLIGGGGGAVGGSAAAVGGGGSLASLMAKGNWSGVAGASGTGTTAASGAGTTAATASRLGAAGRIGGAVSRFAGPVGAAVSLGATMFDQYEDMKTDPSTLRAIGRQAVRAPDMLMGGEIARMFGFKSGGPLGQAYDAVFGSNPANAAAAAPTGQKTQALIAQAGFTDFDTAYRDAAQEVALTDAGEREEGGKLDARELGQRQLAELQEIKEELRRQRSLPPLR